MAIEAVSSGTSAARTPPLGQIKDEFFYRTSDIDNNGQISLNESLSAAQTPSRVSDTAPADGGDGNARADRGRADASARGGEVLAALLPALTQLQEAFTAAGATSGNQAAAQLQARNAYQATQNLLG